MGRLLLPLLLMFFMIAPFSFYTVNEWERAILFQTGKIYRQDIQPGLHFKIPIFQYVYKFDGRILSLDSAPEQFLTSEKKNVIVDSFVKWRIYDLGKYYTSVAGKQEEAIRRLDQIIKGGIRSEFGNHTVKEVVSGKKTILDDPVDLENDSTLSTEEKQALNPQQPATTTTMTATTVDPAENIRLAIMRRLTQRANEHARNELGIEIVDVRIKRVDLPEGVSGSVYRRMKAERERDAKDFRARGAEEAERIRADADKQSTIIRANAYRDSEKIRGDGDAQATALYARSYAKDPEFYAFYRRLNAYKASFNKPNDVLLLHPDTDFFRYFKTPPSTPPTAAMPSITPPGSP